MFFLFLIFFNKKWLECIFKIFISNWTVIIDFLKNIWQNLIIFFWTVFDL